MRHDDRQLPINKRMQDKLLAKENEPWGRFAGYFPVRNDRIWVKTTGSAS